MSENVVVLTFPTREATYEALTAFRNASGDYGLQSAALVERDASGAVNVTDGGDEKGGTATIGGSLIGMLVGALGGPVGLLLGLSFGTLGGALVDGSRLDKGDDVLSQFAGTVPPGTNAIIAETVEEDTSILDNAVAQRGGVVVRWTLDEVLDALDAQQDAAEEASHAAHNALREERHEEHKRRVRSASRSSRRSSTTTSKS